MKAKKQTKVKTKKKPKSKKKSRKPYSQKDPIGFRIKDLTPLIKATGKSLYRIQKETGIPSGFLFYLNSNEENRLNPSFSTLTRLRKALGLASWDDLIEPIPENEEAELDKVLPDKT